MKKNPNQEIPVKKLIILALALALAGFIAIHIVYKLNGPDWLVSEWAAGDTLAYYGALIASVITIYGLYLTFKDNRRGISEQSRLDKLPYLGITMLHQFFRVPYLDPDNAQEIKVESRAFGSIYDGYHYTEAKPDTIFCVISGGNTSCKRSLPKEMLSLISHQGMEIVHVANGLSLTTHHSLLYVPLEITNVGNGAAIDLYFGFNKLDGMNKVTERFTPPIPLKVDSDLYIAIYADNNGDENCGSYLMEYYYKDIFGNQYVQRQVFVLGINASERYFATLENGLQQEQIDRSLLPVPLQS